MCHDETLAAHHWMVVIKTRYLVSLRHQDDSDLLRAGTTSSRGRKRLKMSSPRRSRGHGQELSLELIVFHGFNVRRADLTHATVIVDEDAPKAGRMDYLIPLTFCSQVT